MYVVQKYVVTTVIVHARRVTGVADGQWQLGDQLERTDCVATTPKHIPTNSPGLEIRLPIIYEHT